MALLPLAAALAALMRPRDGDRAEQKLRCLSAIGRAGLDEARELLLVDTVETHLRLNATEQTRYAEKLESVAPEVRVMTWAEEMENKGRILGRAEGARDALRRLLVHRFGELPAATVRRLDAVTDLDELDRLVDRAVDARNLGELGLSGT